MGRNDEQVEVEEGVGLNDEANKPNTMDEDIGLSPCIPPVEFHGTNDETSFASCEKVNGRLQLKCRLRGLCRGLVVHCTIPNSLEMSTSTRYGPCSNYNCYQALKKLHETQVYGCLFYTTS